MNATTQALKHSADPTPCRPAGTPTARRAEATPHEAFLRGWLCRAAAKHHALLRTVDAARRFHGA